MNRDPQRRRPCGSCEATLRRTCPHFKPARWRPGCKGFEQGITEIGGWTIYHCKHDPVTELQVKFNV